MPRPGPRPYECVRRAWHSDRHQPMRGSIIQQIFRVVHENHSPGTKKNREWQEKLPLVVLKCEEIMYSKAHSEAEYTDSETLWDRVNDAVGTIIRIEDSTETGDLLPPCVEAALNLGCVPERASRSQRNSTPRSYLGPRSQDSGSTLPNVLDKTTHARGLNLPSFPTSMDGNPARLETNPIGYPSSRSQDSGCAPKSSDKATLNHDLLAPNIPSPMAANVAPLTCNRISFLSLRSQDSSSTPSKVLDSTAARDLNFPNFPMPMATNQAHLRLETNRCVTKNSNDLPQNIPSNGNNRRFIYSDNDTLVNMGSVYPLYYGAHFQPDKLSSNTIIVGTPIFQEFSKPSEQGHLHNQYSSNLNRNSSTFQSNAMVNQEKQAESMNCDLSLRLGLSSEPYLAPSNDSNCSEKSSSLKEFSFFPLGTTSKPSSFV